MSASVQDDELGPMFLRRCVGVDGRGGVGARCGGPIRVLICVVLVVVFQLVAAVVLLCCSIW